MLDVRLRLKPARTDDVASPDEIELGIEMLCMHPRLQPRRPYNVGSPFLLVGEESQCRSDFGDAPLRVVASLGSVGVSVIQGIISCKRIEIGAVQEALRIRLSEPPARWIVESSPIEIETRKGLVAFR